MHINWVWPGDKKGAMLQKFNMISYVYGFAISQNNNNSKWRRTKCNSMFLEFRQERIEFTYIILRGIRGRVLIITKAMIHSEYEKESGSTENLKELQHEST